MSICNSMLWDIFINAVPGNLNVESSTGIEIYSSPFSLKYIAP